MIIHTKDFRVPPAERVKLDDWPTIVKPFGKAKDAYLKLLGEHVKELRARCAAFSNPARRIIRIDL